MYTHPSTAANLPCLPGSSALKSHVLTSLVPLVHNQSVSSNTENPAILHLIVTDSHKHGGLLIIVLWSRNVVKNISPGFTMSTDYLLIPAIISEFPPHHLTHNSNITLNDLSHLGAYILLHISRHGDFVVTFLVHGYGGVYGLLETYFINAGQDKTSFVQCFRTLGADECIPPEGAVQQEGEATAFLYCFSNSIERKIFAF